jgi:hypothetical protein
MKIKKLLENWDMTSLKINTGFLEMEWSPQEKDREAAWELYIEMLTRITTQPLPLAYGDEKTALESIYSLFPITREILRRKGRDCVEFSKIAVVVLNQIVRPFTAKWHKIFCISELNANEKLEFRSDLELLQVTLKNYTKALADIADVEDLTEISALY